MPNNGEQQPPGPPDYKVYRSRRSLLSRLRTPDLSGLRERSKRSSKRPDGERAARAQAGQAAAAAGPPRRVLKWVGAGGAGLDPAQLPRLRRLRPAPVVQALRRSQVRAARQPLPAAQRPDDPGARHRRPPDGHQGTRCRRPAAPSQKCFEQQAHGDAPHGSCSAGRIPRRHPDADPGRRGRLPQTLDPARQLRRNPRPGNAENQRRLRLRRRGAADQDGRKVPRHQDRPRRDRRLHRLRKADRRGRRGRSQRPAQALRRNLRRRRPRPGRDDAAAEQGREHARRAEGPRLLAGARAERMPRARARAPTRSATTTSTGRRPSRR